MRLYLASLLGFNKHSFPAQGRSLRSDTALSSMRADFEADQTIQTSLQKWLKRSGSESFVVSEIALDGTVADLLLSDDVVDLPLSENIVSSVEAQRNVLNSLLNADKSSYSIGLREGLRFAAENPVTSTPEAYISCENLSKDERGQFHRELRELASTLVDSRTENTSTFKVWRKTPNSKLGRWQPGTPEYLKFVLQKKGKTTGEAIDELALRLNCKAERFEYSGLKDKLATTTQFITLWRPLPDSAQMLKTPSGKNGGSAVRVGLFRMNDTPLHIGVLSGNRFSIVLSTVDNQAQGRLKQVSNLKQVISETVLYFAVPSRDL